MLKTLHYFNFLGLTPFPGNETFIPDVRSVSVYKFQNSTFLAVANYHLDARNGYNIFKLKFHRNETVTSVKTIPDIVKDMLKRMKEELNEVKNDLP